MLKREISDDFMLFLLWISKIFKFFLGFLRKKPNFATSFSNEGDIYIRLGR